MQPQGREHQGWGRRSKYFEVESRKSGVNSESFHKGVAGLSVGRAELSFLHDRLKFKGRRFIVEALFILQRRESPRSRSRSPKRLACLLKKAQ